MKLLEVKIKFLREVIGGNIGWKKDVERLKELAPESVKEHIDSASVFLRNNGRAVLEEKHLKGHLHARAKGFGLSRKRIGGIGFVSMIKRGIVLLDPYIVLGPEEEITPKFIPGPRGTGIKSMEKILPTKPVEFRVKILYDEFLPYFQKFMKEGYMGASTSQGYGRFNLIQLREVESGK